MISEKDRASSVLRGTRLLTSGDNKVTLGGEGGGERFPDYATRVITINAIGNVSGSFNI